MICSCRNYLEHILVVAIGGEFVPVVAKGEFSDAPGSIYRSILSSCRYYMEDFDYRSILVNSGSIVQCTGDVNGDANNLTSKAARHPCQLQKAVDNLNSDLCFWNETIKKSRLCWIAKTCACLKLFGNSWCHATHLHQIWQQRLRR